MQYVQLESEKYLCQKLDEQIKQVKRTHSRKAIRDLMTFFVGVALIPVAVLVAHQLPNWFPNFLPTLGAWVEQLGSDNIVLSFAKFLK